MNARYRQAGPGKPNQSATLAVPTDRDRVPFDRRVPVGAEVIAGQGVHFRVWAPRSKFVSVQLGNDLEELAATAIDLEPEEDGYFSGLIPEAQAGMLYQYRLDSGAFPDPASRFQPEGPHGPSQIVDPTRFRWTDFDWKGMPRTGQVIYEMHIGTFTHAGTWSAAAEQLPALAKLGVTLLEIMPVAEFPGRFGWGYDGVDLFAPSWLYGAPDQFREFVNRAHELNLGVILDVVYNHVGPDGNYLKEYSADYFTNRHTNEWGESINFDGPGSAAVREFFQANAGYWIDEFHLDGLRFDATQQIFDDSSEHILAAIGRHARRIANGRSIYLVAENEPQESQLVRDLEAGGRGLDALWNDDFHHCAQVAVTGRREAYYSDYRGSPQEFISAMKRGHLYQGQYYSWQKKRRGQPADGIGPEQFVNCIQNHDQIANSLRGQRLHQLTSPGRFRALTALLLLGPATPMLFQGQEFAASAPFLYFADHKPDLAKLVSEGRRHFMEQFPSITCAEFNCALAEPSSEETFHRCKLDFAERESHAPVFQLHRDLLKLRREDAVFSKSATGALDGAVLAAECFVLRFFGEVGGDRLLFVNFGIDVRRDSIPEPLLAPPVNRKWKLLWSSEDPRYGGGGTPPVETESAWQIPGHAAVVLTSHLD